MSEFFHLQGEPATLQQIKESHVIPVYTRDNIPLVSQTAFIEQAITKAADKWGSVLEPQVRVSHPVKGRIYEARHKAKKDLLPHEETIYFERMGFAAEIPGFAASIDGKETFLTVAGVKAYNEDSLNKEGSIQHFRFAIGRSVRICLNMCLSVTQGVVKEIKITEEDQLALEIQKAIDEYDAEKHLSSLQRLTETRLTEKQYALLLGRMRMLDAMGAKQNNIAQIEITDTQMRAAARAYYDIDNPFRARGDISTWNFYNLLTDSVKTSYLDTFIQRSANAYDLADGIDRHLRGEENEFSWFLN